MVEVVWTWTPLAAPSMAVPRWRIITTIWHITMPQRRPLRLQLIITIIIIMALGRHRSLGAPQMWQCHTHSPPVMFRTGPSLDGLDFEPGQRSWSSRSANWLIWWTFGARSGVHSNALPCRRRLCTRLRPLTPSSSNDNCNCYIEYVCVGLKVHVLVSRSRFCSRRRNAVCTRISQFPTPQPPLATTK